MSCEHAKAIEFDEWYVVAGHRGAELRYAKKWCPDCDSLQILMHGHSEGRWLSSSLVKTVLLTGVVIFSVGMRAVVTREAFSA